MIISYSEHVQIIVYCYVCLTSITHIIQVSLSCVQTMHICDRLQVVVVEPLQQLFPQALHRFSPVRQGSQFLATENAGDASEVNILEGYSRSTPRYLSHRISGHTRCHT